MLRGFGTPTGGGLVAIPEFTQDGLLPPGIHSCTFHEVQSRFGFTLTRVAIALGLRQMIHNLPDGSAVKHIITDGSFVQNVANPTDVDVVLVVESLKDGDPGQLLLSWIARRHLDLKAMDQLDVYVADEQTVREYWLGKFGSTRDGRSKGMLKIVRKGDGPDDY